MTEQRRSDRVARRGRDPDVVEVAGSQRQKWNPSGDEPDLELLFVRADELRRLVLDGEFRMAGHLALLTVALLRGFLE